ncbi:MAG: permease-like cell division protein FtsX [Thermomonas sp.]|jgi:cell division transport system permease protein|uniref:permease-like cell division protein FtsX n=1 Tax=Thermomonas sp. TaxID=1971895 RepID=UPI001B3FAAC5|nr:permease-like cell division protein FtsX [Thermomonas sp.]MBK6925674.1 ABC transporter permease [Thermomonas sp.]MBP6438613.1 permease-like cell division protein FtsX [Thermomonas sp.]MBP7788839.1 permease-like cell division protein FtsX [Thermomonas sp.]MBP8648264.1 permease-like cell division protein FtsX [Thermomonas sp.]HRA03244.1 permease-like cell division protein FtsX [Thermomonas sp.]
MNERSQGAQASRLGTWLDHHGFSIVASLGRLLRRPWATLLTIGVMALALALPLGLWVVLDNMARLGGEVHASRDIAIFLKPEVGVAKAQAIAGSLRARGDVATVVLVTPRQALQELRARPELAAAIDAMGADAAQAALPSVLRVSPRGDEQLLAESLRTLPEAERVQHDAVWRERLDAWLRFGGRVVLVLAALFGLGALLVVGNTVRLDIQSRREEIGVLQLLGASDGFVRRPFLYLGAWYGLAAGALALGVLTAAWMALRQPLAELAAEYGSSFALRGLDPLPAACVLLAAGALGWLGAGLVTGHYLRQTRPVER